MQLFLLSIVQQDGCGFSEMMKEVNKEEKTYHPKDIFFKKQVSDNKNQDTQ